VERADRGGAAPWLIADADVIVAGPPASDLRAAIRPLRPQADLSGRRAYVVAAPNGDAAIPGSVAGLYV
jgi:hypothetical protein